MCEWCVVVVVAELSVSPRRKTTSGGMTSGGGGMTSHERRRRRHRRRTGGCQGIRWHSAVRRTIEVYKNRGDKQGYMFRSMRLINFPTTEEKAFMRK